MARFLVVQRLHQFTTLSQGSVRFSMALGMPYMWQARSVGMQRVVVNRPTRCREKDAAQLIRTIVSVVAHCHHLGVIHRRAACCCMAPCTPSAQYC